MKIKSGMIAFIAGAVFTGALLGGCGSTAATAVNSPAGSFVAGKVPAAQTVRLVDSAGNPVPGVMAMMYPETGSPIRVGLSSEKGEIVVPGQQRAVYVFLRNGQTLLAQTAENLFSVGPSAAYLYRRDGDVLIVPLSLAPTVSPRVSPVIDPLSAVPQVVQPLKAGN